MAEVPEYNPIRCGVMEMGEVGDRLDIVLLERVRLCELFDAYSSLLTEKQREACGLMLRQDLSAAEIGVELGMTRQGAHDLVKRSLERLDEIERVLGLIGLRNAYESLRSLIDESRGALPVEFLERAVRLGVISEGGKADV
jgi:predicted DNA-binding protein YlxM (UPF0122 family)